MGWAVEVGVLVDSIVSCAVGDAIAGVGGGEVGCAEAVALGSWDGVEVGTEVAVAEGSPVAVMDACVCFISWGVGARVLVGLGVVVGEGGMLSTVDLGV